MQMQLSCHDQRIDLLKLTASISIGTRIWSDKTAPSTLYPSITDDGSEACFRSQITHNETVSDVSIDYPNDATESAREFLDAAERIMHEVAAFLPLLITAIEDATTQLDLELQPIGGLGYCAVYIDFDERGKIAPTACMIAPTWKGVEIADEAIENDKLQPRLPTSPDEPGTFYQDVLRWFTYLKECPVER
jgi:hypothetical protein